MSSPTTQVKFEFFGPDGEPLADTDFEVRLSRSGFRDPVDGIVMPDTIMATTGEDGSVILHLAPSNSLYYLSVPSANVDDEGCSGGIYYKFYVPITEEGVIVRVQDLILDPPPTQISWDEAAVLFIVQAKTDAEAAAVAAAASAAAALQSEINADASEYAAGQSQIAAAASADAAAASAASVSDDAAAAALSAQQAAQSAVSAANSANTALTAVEDIDAQVAEATRQAGISTSAANSAAASAATAQADANITTANAAATAADAASTAADAASTAADVVESTALRDETSALTDETEGYRDEVAAMIGSLGAVIADGGPIDLSGGVYPPKPVMSTMWKVVVGGTIISDGVQYGIGDTLMYSAPPIDIYYKLDANDNVTSVNGQMGAVVIDAADLGLGNVNNTSDANKPISNAQQTEFDLKSDIADIRDHLTSIEHDKPLSANQGRILANMIGVGGENSGTLKIFEFVAALNQTTFSGNDIHGQTLAYNIGPGTIVYQNGVQLQNLSDYQATDGLSVILVLPVEQAGDLITINAFGKFALTDVYTKAEVDAEFAQVDADLLLKVSQSSATGAVKTTKGTTAQRPAVPEVGDFRYNTETKKFEGFADPAKGWVPIGVDSVPLFSVFWVPLRGAMPAGFVAADGQVLSRATYPEAAAGFIAGNVPIATENNWLIDPAWRACYTAGDGSTTFRLPDYNGKSQNSLGAVFLRGDGVGSNGTDGIIQRDQFQNHGHSIYTMAIGSGGGAYDVPLGNVVSESEIVNGNTMLRATGAMEGLGGPLRTGAESRPLNATGCWAIKLFGAVVNPGSVDAAQLATDMANMKSDMQNNYYRRNNILAPVAQAAGVPTGGIIQQGGNSNGYFVRYADGTQICRVGSSYVPAASPGISTFTWVYPIAFYSYPDFIDSYAQIGTGGNPQSYLAQPQYSAVGTAQCIFNCYTVSQVGFGCFAIGRWFQ